MNYTYDRATITLVQYAYRKSGVLAADATAADRTPTRTVA
jgi:hypothetical protein